MSDERFGEPIPDASCAAPETIWEASSGALPPERARQLIVHAESCPACTEAWRMAAELHRTIPAPAAARSVRRRVLAAAATVAAACVVIALVPLLRDTLPPAAVPHRGGSTSLAVLVADDTRLPRAEFTLRWHGGPDGTRYHVEVVNDEFQPIFSTSDLTEPYLTVPPERLADLQAGSRLLWRVEASLPDGSRLDSPAHFVRVGP